MTISKMNVNHCGGGAATEMIAMTTRRTLKGFGSTERRICHHAKGFLVDKTLGPTSLDLVSTSSLLSPSSVDWRWAIAWSAGIFEYARRIPSVEVPSRWVALSQLSGNPTSVSKIQENGQYEEFGILLAMETRNSLFVKESSDSVYVSFDLDSLKKRDLGPGRGLYAAEVMTVAFPYDFLIKWYAIFHLFPINQ